MLRFTLTQLDLNLLAVLDTLLEEGSVMGAAERLHLSSPAVSRTLGRLRAVTGDDILVRTGHSMVPTPYAASVREDVHRLVGEAREVLSPVRELDPAELDRTWHQRYDPDPATPGSVSRSKPRSRRSPPADYSACPLVPPTAPGAEPRNRDNHAPRPRRASPRRRSPG
ncbi:MULTISPECIES: LysR family transcriptional regulator [unclassified Streptomyces]|uniref:LysR family transcriptional regulator n=1 Tax=unclassified Streptomyces TaxID=2593676 RepID=UPI003FA3A7C4